MSEELRECPMMDNENISLDNCFENCMIAERYLKPDSLPEKVKSKEGFREICLSCKYHDLS